MVKKEINKLARELRAHGATFAQAFKLAKAYYRCDTKAWENNGGKTSIDNDYVNCRFDVTYIFNTWQK